MKRFKYIPVPAVAATLASLTLGNVYGGLGYTWLRALIMLCGTLMVLAYLVKIIFFSKTCLAEYNETIPASLYALFPMCMMILGCSRHFSRLHPPGFRPLRQNQAHSP